MALSREQNIAKARELREQGLVLREIGERLGVHQVTVWQWLNPGKTRDKQRKDAAKRGPAKRQWERDNRAGCPQCGSEMGQGSRSPSKRFDRCAACRRTNARSRWGRLISLREQGLTNREIASATGTTAAAVASTLYTAGQHGFEVPPPPYWSRGKSSGQVAA